MFVTLLTSSIRCLIISSCLLFLIQCTATSDEVLPTTDATLIINSDHSFEPEELNIPSEGTLTIINRDTVAHSVTSQSNLDTFDDSGDFDIIIPAGSATILTLPTLTSGATYYFYCRFLEDTMLTPNGSLNVD